jgi:hypothetical protein
MLKLLKLTLLVLCFSIIFLSELAYADGAEFATSLSDSSLDNLEKISKKFKEKGTSSKVIFEVPTKVGLLRLKLEPNEIRSKNYKSQFTTSNGVISDTANVSLFKGSVIGQEENSFVRISVISGIKGAKRKLSGFMKSAGTYYSLKSDPVGTDSLFVKEVTEKEIAKLVAQCGLNTSTANILGGSSPLTSMLPNSDFVSVSSLKVVEVATDADFDFVSRLGGQNNANAEILSTLNAVDGIYQEQLSLKLIVTFQNAWTTSSDPYSTTDAVTLLNQFVNYWNGNFRSSKTYDVAHLFTGRTMDSGVAGIAYVGTVCQYYNYGLSEWFNDEAFDIPVVAHEIGHNFGSDHDNCNGGQTFIMCPFLNPGADVFSTLSRNSISSFVGQISCLEDSVVTKYPPVLGAIGPKSVTEQSTLTFNVSATDVDSETVTITNSKLPYRATFIGGVFSYTPALTVVEGAGSEVKYVTFTATDGDGLSDSETVAITINNKNQAPVFGVFENQVIDEGSLLTVSLPVIDADVDQLYFNPVQRMPEGAVLDSETGEFSWRPTGDQAGNYSLEFQVKDSFNAFDTETLLITVNDKSGIPPLPALYVKGDFNGDGKADVSVYSPYSGAWVHGDFSGTKLKRFKFGLPGDVPMIGDYDGDRITDFVVFRPSESKWYVRYSGTGSITSTNFGIEGDIPIPGDFDRDGRSDFAIFRPEPGSFYYRKSSDGLTIAGSGLGEKHDLPVPCDYNGDRKSDYAVIRFLADGKANWIIRNDDGSLDEKIFGVSTDYFVPGDYMNTGRCQRASFRPRTGKWFVEGYPSSVAFGAPGDVPVPADYDGDGEFDFMLARVDLEGLFWYLDTSKNGTPAPARHIGYRIDKTPISDSMFFGLRHKHGNKNILTLGGVGPSVGFFRPSNDIFLTVSKNSDSQKSITANPGSTVLRGDYDGDGVLDIASYDNGAWRFYYANGTTSLTYWGTSTDKPIASDFDGDGKTDIGIYRPGIGSGKSSWWILWSTAGVKVYKWGLSADLPLPADFNGDGLADLATWRPSDGAWSVFDTRDKNQITSLWGNNGDVPFSTDLDGDERADYTVWRPSSGYWYIRNSGDRKMTASLWGTSGDKPFISNFSSSSTRDISVYRPTAKAIYSLTLQSNTFTPILLPNLQSQDRIVVPPFAPVN